MSTRNDPRPITRIPRARGVPTDEPAVYTVAEVAHLLSLSLGATYALVRSGRIPARRLGARWVIPRRRFAEWLDETDELDDAPGQVPATGRQ